MKSQSLLLMLFVSVLFLTTTSANEQKERAVIFSDTEDVAWQPVEGVAGAKWKPMRTDPVTGAVTAVVQFPAGAVENPHHHSQGHMIYILSGAKVVENLSAKKDFALSEGMYLYTPAGNLHRIRYLTRCTFLFVTDGPFDMIWHKK